MVSTIVYILIALTILAIIQVVLAIVQENLRRNVSKLRSDINKLGNVVDDQWTETTLLMRKKRCQCIEESNVSSSHCSKCFGRVVPSPIGVSAVIYSSDPPKRIADVRCKHGVSLNENCSDC